MWATKSSRTLLSVDYEESLHRNKLNQSNLGSCYTKKSPSISFRWMVFSKRWLSFNSYLKKEKNKDKISEKFCNQSTMTTSKLLNFFIKYPKKKLFLSISKKKPSNHLAKISKTWVAINLPLADLPPSEKVKLNLSPITRKALLLFLLFHCFKLYCRSLCRHWTWHESII